MKALLLILCALTLGTTAQAKDLPAPITDADYLPVNLDEAQLGQLLFYDPVLSGNEQTACATCHHPALGTSDGVSLSFGDGGIGMGPQRIADPDNPPEERIPRNSPALFNLGAHEFTVMFHDGRLEADPTHPNGIRTPMGGDMTTGFASVLSAQTMFPVLSRDEMAGSYNENEVGQLVRQGRITGAGGAWDVLSRRIAALPAYAARFETVYSHINTPDDIAFTDISNAIAAFVAYEWRSDTAPFDAYLRGKAKLSPAADAGRALFYGAAGCSVCHAGPFQTDHSFHAMGAPQIGPGKSATFQDHHRDEGRFRVTGRDADLYAFRTPSLRNVTLTAPYGHAGAHRDLDAFITAHIDPARGLSGYDRAQAVLPAYSSADFTVMDDPTQIEAIAKAVTVQPLTLTKGQLGQITAFLETLTDPVSISGRLGVPETVPSSGQVAVVP